MATIITEADLFYTTHPFVLIRKYSPEQLEAWFGPSNRPINNIEEYGNQLLSDIWQKYCRIDLIKWDPVPDAVFFDYRSQKFLSLNQFEENLGNYSLMSLRHLELQLETAISRWNLTAEPFHLLMEKIRQKLQNAMKEYILDPSYPN